jgi:class 3 adenylate cyclase
MRRSRPIRRPQLLGNGLAAMVRSTERPTVALIWIALRGACSEQVSVLLQPPQIVGIATGLVVVGDLIGSGASQEQAIVGKTPNLAARLQGIAAPGMVVIADSTRSSWAISLNLRIWVGKT